MGNSAERLIKLLRERSLFLAAAESCTAGMLGSMLGEIPGASACFWGSFVCYTPQAKIAMLGMGEEILVKYGLVSEETARAMALGALKKSGAHAAVSITGLAGPGGDGSPVPVGTVWIGTALWSGKVQAMQFHFDGPRHRIRLKAAGEALEQISKQLLEEPVSKPG
ncbi:MAG: CinA family protein [Spirochaetaceae bacterium]|jgi:PncC family amidohydrolase|nr:CinA family protein [Spirochaetaceae bacterium]